MPFASSGTMRRYRVSYSWQILKKELVRSVRGPGRGEWEVAQTGILRKGEAGVGGGPPCTFWGYSVAQRVDFHVRLQKD